MRTLSEVLVKIKMQPFSHLNSQTPLISIYGSPKGTIGLRNLCARNRELSKAIRGGFPGGAVVGSLPANAGNIGSSPDLGRSHMLQSSWAHEPQLLSLRVWSLCSTTGEAAIVRGPRTAMRSGPSLPQLEEALAQKRRPNTASNN